MSEQQSTSQRHPMVPGCRCGAAWPGNTVCHCSRCHTTFTTAGNFDRHRRDGTCLPPDACGLELKNRAGYTVWGMPGRDDEATDAA